MKEAPLPLRHHISGSDFSVNSSTINGWLRNFLWSQVWAHHKLKIINVVQPRALSISQGRAVGLIHYTLGGVGCTWAFVISRMVVVS
jgi:photosystem I P700 chlorophyll a apoprotein A1